jgi:hypothetical protein
MALTPEDRAFYEEKLGWKGYVYLWALTTVVGAIIWPLLLYIQDASAGQTSKWSSTVVGQLAFCGALMGTTMSVIMYLIARFYLWMGWLPSRR